MDDRGGGVERAQVRKRTHKDNKQIHWARHMILYNNMSSRRAEIYDEQEERQKLQKGFSHMQSHIFPLSSLYPLFLPNQQVGGMRGGHIVLTACATRLQSDIITPFIFIQSDRTERQRQREERERERVEKARERERERERDRERES